MLPRGYLPAEFLRAEIGYNTLELPLNITNNGQEIVVRTVVQALLPTTDGEGYRSGSYALTLGIYPGNNNDGIAGNEGIFCNFWTNGAAATPTPGMYVDPGPYYDIGFRGYANGNWDILFNGEIIGSRTNYGISSTPYWRLFGNRNIINRGLFGNKKNWRYWVNGKLKMDLLPCLDNTGHVCMYDVLNKTPYTDTYGTIIVGMTVSQARYLRNLPVVESGTLTVSLPWEAQLIASGVPAILQAAADKGWTITVQYREPEADNEYYNRYAECVTVDDMIAVNPDYKNDLTADGAWIYPLPKLQNAEMAFASMRCKSAKFYMPELVRGRRIFQLLSGKSTTYAESVEVYAPKLILKSNYYEGVEIIFIEARIRELKVEFSPATTYISRDFAIFGLQNFEMNEMPNLTGLPGAFRNAELNKTSILRLIAQLPTWESGNHLATFGIHTDLQTDEDVIAAIDNAETKGWNVTVQWNGTATAQTASTFGLRKPPIYAKLGTVERPDGTTENVLDWGHYATNWEENGYQEFSSVEEAEEYFNINQIEEV